MSSPPPLYKYMDLNGARLTLQNRAFRFAKPSEFNDTEELTYSSFFAEPLEEAWRKFDACFVCIIQNNLKLQPTVEDESIRAAVVQLQAAISRNPQLIKHFISEFADKPSRSLESFKQIAKNILDEINAHMAGHRIFCVTSHSSSDYMWSKYACNHNGIVLRIEPNLKKDSIFQLFRSVRYETARPALYKNVCDFTYDLLFADKECRNRQLMERVIYTKTMEWESESEYRISVPIFQGETWTTLRFHPDEITEIVLGSKVSHENKIEIVRLAKNINPEIKVLSK